MANQFNTSVDEKGREVIEVTNEDKQAINAAFYATLKQIRMQYPHVQVTYKLDYLPVVSIPVLKHARETHNGNTVPVAASNGAKHLKK